MVDQIRGKQMQDDELVKEVHKIMNGDIGEKFWITQDEVLTMKGRVCVLDILMIWEDLSWKKHIVQPMLCIWVVPKCTELSRKIISGLVWKKM